ncbi:hypothetical protein Cgig2_018073 [Carnegiea gigantea]|uniref:Uncharacterized protein n=1 Tax=Carnegiea gigantea TaxID=171969 RepID=A0A9Q1KAG7_9CARY|nr:hypothetical protein Cgig2_018073 [Carnegiea gigantea]
MLSEFLLKGLSEDFKRQLFVGDALLPVNTTEEMALHILETFNWCLRRATRPRRPLLEDYHDLCLYFMLADAGKAACNFHIPDLAQAIFYAAVVNKALELGVFKGNLAEDLRSPLVGIRRFIVEAWPQVNRKDILVACRPRSAALREGLLRTNSQEESIGSNDAPSPSRDDDDETS